MQKSLMFLLKNPSYTLGALIVKLSFLFPTERLYLKTLYKYKMGKPLNLDNPQTFNEKLNWLKLYNRKPIYTKMVDKFMAKDHVASIIGDEYVIPLLGVWDSGEDIQWDKLPNKFVLKVNNGGGGNAVIICKDKEKLDKQNVVNILNAHLNSNLYKANLEWPYKDIKPKILAEYCIECEDGDLRDYKFFCFNGVVKFCKVDFNRFSGHRANYYDTNWELLPFGEVVCPPQSDHIEECPKNFSKMIEIAEKLSSSTPFLRVDLYNINGKIYFGEMTFYPGAGFNPFTPEEYDLKIGQLLELPVLK